MTSTPLPQIGLAQIPPEYSGKIIALNKAETKIIAVANTFPALFNKLKRQDIDPQDCVYFGPIPKYGTAQVV